MNILYKHKYRIPSARLQSWDYGTNGAYFVTICTHERQHFFGEIRNGEMRLNAAGMLAAEIWQLLPQQFPYVVLDEFVIMPNHIHGLLYINHPLENQCTDAINRVSADANSADAKSADADLYPKKGGITGEKNPMLQENLSRIIRWFKGRTTYEIRKQAINQGTDAINRVSASAASAKSADSAGNFAWQTRFHDHIVRTNDAFIRIQTYILNNPLQWKEDKFY